MKTRSVFLLSTVLGWAITTCSAATSAPEEIFKKLPERPMDLAKDRNLYVVGYSHLDTQWRWAYPVVIREFIANTLNDNFALLEKYPNYLFNFSGSRRYEMMQEYFPKEFQRMKAYVTAGRWFPAGSSVDENDANVPSGESMVRSVLYGNHYFRREFGVASDEFMVPDCFGFSASLPTVLNHSSIKGFSTQKLTWGSAVGIPFKVGVWSGVDGNSVIAALDPGAYVGKVTEDLSQNGSWLKRIENTGKQSGAYIDYHYYGTGDRGGAPDDNSVRWIERSLAGNGPVRVISSRADEMFNDLKPEQVAKLPRYQGEFLLTEHSAGSITSQAYMKRWNRKNELLADAAERAAVASLWLGGGAYPSKKLYDAWILLLGSQMHDILPGTSIPKAYEFSWNDEILAANQFAAVEENSVGAVASAMDTRAAGVPLVIYNPLSVAREDVVEATIPASPGGGQRLAAIGPDGTESPVQILSRNGDVMKVIFVAAVDPVSFSVFDIRPATKLELPAQLTVTSDRLENARYRVTVAASGDVTSIFDKQAGRELLAGPARLEFHHEKPERFPAWNMDWADRQKPAYAAVDGPASITVVEEGPVRVALRIEREAEGSRFVQTLRLAAGGAGNRVEYANQIDWRTHESSLKAAFHLASGNPIATYDMQVGAVQRGNNDEKKYEVPQHQWFDVTAPDNSFGVAILNDSKFGSDKPDDSTVRLTLLYTPGVKDRFQDQSTQDFGRHETVYAVTSHVGDWRGGGVNWEAARLNQPLRAFTTPAHEGALGKSLSLLKSSDENVAIMAVKKAEDSDELIVRFRELCGQPQKNVRLTAAASIVSAREVDGQEMPKGEAKLEAGALSFDIGGYSLRAFAVKLATAPTKMAAVQGQTVPLPFNEDVVSTDANRADGRFDAIGRTFPAEQLPAKIVGEGVEFTTGSTADGQMNALSARGQTITLPAGNYNRLYFLAAADGDQSAQFSVDGRAVTIKVQHWGGFLGQWDNRLWKGTNPEVAYYWSGEYIGLEPGYTKRDTVAWFASHRHNPSGNEFYQHSYLFKYVIDLPPGARSFTLPVDPKIRLFALTVAANPYDAVHTAAPLYDTVEHIGEDAPQIMADGREFPDSAHITVKPPLYWHEGGLRYTLDGSTPTATSSVYRGPISVNRTATLQVASFDLAGKTGQVSRAMVNVNDHTPPSIREATALAGIPFIQVAFSEPVEKHSAEQVSNYQLEAPIKVTGAKLNDDGTSVLLQLSAPLTQAAVKIFAHGVTDLSPAANATTEGTIVVTPIAPAFQHPGVGVGESKEVAIVNLPVAVKVSWTMSVFVRPSVAPEPRTLIVGFGQSEVRRGKGGGGRYFAVMADGLHFWSQRSMQEAMPTLAVGKWQMLTASYDGQKLRLLLNGTEIETGDFGADEDESIVRFAPLDPWDKERKFQGEIRSFTIWNRALSDEEISLLKANGVKE